MTASKRLALRAGRNVKAAADAKQCTDALARQPWDLVCLDHDLGGQTYVPTTKGNSGSGVVRWMLAHKPTVGTVVVHSLNGPASQGMVSDLTRAGYAATHEPFFWMRERTIVLPDNTPTTPAGAP